MHAYSYLLHILMICVYTSLLTYLSLYWRWKNPLIMMVSFYRKFGGLLCHGSYEDNSKTHTHTHTKLTRFLVPYLNIEIFFWILQGCFFLHSMTYERAIQRKKDNPQHDKGCMNINSLTTKLFHSHRLNTGSTRLPQAIG